MRDTKEDYPNFLITHFLGILDSRGLSLFNLKKNEKKLKSLEPRLRNLYTIN